VTNPQNITSSAFFSAISESVASLTTTGASGVEQETVSASASTDPGESVFSTALSVAPSAANALTRNVTVGNQDHVAVGFVATQGTTPTSVPSTTTGSSIRDLMRVLAVVGSLDQTDASSGEFSTLVSDTSKQMSSVSSSLTESVASIGQTQAQLTAQSTMLSSVTDALTKQLGSVKDSDAATLSTQISATQNQLTASYTLIADMKGMSLASYI
jgi:flagellar hook-associated protein 3 FlgL